MDFLNAHHLRLPRWCGAPIAFALLMLVFGAQRVDAQVPDALEPGDSLYTIELADGTEFVARVVAMEGGLLTVRTAGGVRLEIERASVVRMRLAQGRVQNGEFWPEDPHATQFFVGPTGRSLRQGTGSFAVYELFMPFVSYGVTDRLTLAGGMPVLLGSLDVYYIAPKLRVLTRPGLDIAAGALAFGVFGESDHYGVAYGVATFGSPDAALTVGAGWGFAGSEVTDRPVFMVGGETRVSRRIKLMSENYFLDAVDGALLSGGMRFISGRLSADVGVGAAVPGGCCLPLVNFSYIFSGNQ